MDEHDASCRRPIPFDEENLLPLRELPENQNAIELSDQYFYNVGQTTNCRRLFIADNGSQGLAPIGAAEGYVTALSLDCEVPIVLRDQGDGTYKVVK